MNGYDFDKTIYKKDSSVEFYLFLIKRHLYLLYHLFYFAFCYALYKLRIKNKIFAKEAMFSITKHIRNIDSEVELFWKDKKLEDWYLKKQKKNDIIISASPEFLLLPFLKKNNITNLISTNVNKKTGKIIGNNCYGEEKPKMFRKKYADLMLDNFYTDSKSDLSMQAVSKKVIIKKE